MTIRNFGKPAGGPKTPRRTIDKARADRPFMAALLDRDHPGHRAAVAEWSRLHQAAYGGREGLREPVTAVRRGVADPSGTPRREPVLRLADSGIDDWEEDRRREGVHPRGGAAVGNPDPREAEGQQPLAGSSDQAAGAWAVDHRSPNRRDFTLVNPVTDRPVTDGEGRPIAYPPEAFKDDVPAAARPYQQSLLDIWHIREDWPGAKSGIAYGIMLDMLQVRGMSADEQRDLYRRIEVLPDQLGADGYVIAGHLRARLRRVLAEPFWFPQLMTEAELREHLQIAKRAESVGSSAAWAATGSSAILPLAPGASPLVGNVGLHMGVMGEHYGSRSDAYERELARRRDPDDWPPAPDSSRQ